MREGPLTIALVGDVVISARESQRGRDQAGMAVTELLQAASLSIANLEMNLIEPGTAAPKSVWVTGSADEAHEMNRIGITAVSCANNHGADNGADTVDHTIRVLDTALVGHAGCGIDLAAARAPLIVERGKRRIALLGLTTSAVGESRATATRPGIRARKGVRALRYSAEVTVDASTYDLLQQSAPSRTDSRSEMALFGTRIQKGTRTEVTFAANDEDLRQFLEDVRNARAAADIVVVAIHAHEPGNGRQEPAEFVRSIARNAIEAGASLVVGNGPHQLRGIEVHREGVILYSLGNFIFHYHQLRPETADVYNGGVDLYELALGTVDAATPRSMPTFQDDIWWQGAVAVAQFDETRLTSLRLHPIDLGTADSLHSRGTPRAPAADRASAIIQRVRDLSKAFGASVVGDERGIGVVSLDARPSNRSAQ